MFNGKLYKTQSLQKLKGNWKINLLVSVVISLCGYISTLPFAESYADEANFRYGLNLDFTTLLSLVPFAITGIISMASAYFFIGFFKKNQPVSFGTFLEGLNYWLKGILSNLWVTLWITLWSFLFLIPGIVKFYAYSQIYFILAEYPTMSVRKAMEISKIITRSYKGNLFAQDWSFFGWCLLCCLTGGLGFIALTPYYMGAKVHAYSFLKEQALATNTLKESDFRDTI